MNFTLFWLAFMILAELWIIRKLIHTVAEQDRNLRQIWVILDKLHEELHGDVCENGTDIAVKKQYGKSSIDREA